MQGFDKQKDLKITSEPQIDVEAIAIEMGLIQVSDDDTIEGHVDKVIEQHPVEVARYKEGKTGLFGFFMGQVMKASGGKANPEVIKTQLQQKLEITNCEPKT